MKLILTAVDESLATAWQRFCGDLEFVEIHLGSILEVGCAMLLAVRPTALASWMGAVTPFTSVVSGMTFYHDYSS